jgi:hypothetical protein
MKMKYSSTGASVKKVDISALGAKIKLWWNTSDDYQTRDRIQLKQGDRWFFDSGEYLSNDGSGTVRSENINGRSTRYDRVIILKSTFNPTRFLTQALLDNKGDSNSPLAPGYPKVQAPRWR